MIRPLLCKSGVNLNLPTTAIINGVNLNRPTAVVNGEFSSSAKYFLGLQNQNLVVISNPRVTSASYSFSTTTSNGNATCSDASFVVSYLINSCGLSQDKAITASRKLKFETPSQPDSVIALFKSYGFTEPHISELINRDPILLLSKPDKTLKPKLDFFKSKGLSEHDLPDLISRFPRLLKRGLKIEIIPSFDTLRSIVHSDEDVIKMIKRNSRIMSKDQVKRLMVNVELLRNEGVPETNIRKYLIQQPRVYTVNRFRENLEKVKEMGFDHLQTTFLIGLQVLSSMTEDNWRKKMDVYKRWGWSEDQIKTAFRKGSVCMKASEKKITAAMNFLVYEMGYDSSSISADPIVFTGSLKERIIPRCSVIKILVSRGLIKETISLSTLTTLVDDSFLEKFVKKFEQEVPGLMRVFNGELNYQELLKN